MVRPSRIPTAAEARAYLEELPHLWATTSDARRHVIAEATFERIDVLGVTDTGARGSGPGGRVAVRSTSQCRDEEVADAATHPSRRARLKDASG